MVYKKYMANLTLNISKHRNFTLGFFDNLFRQAEVLKFGIRDCKSNKLGK